MGDDMSAYRDVFLSESTEYLQAITNGLIALESDPRSAESIESIFRGAHSLKGMAGAMGYARTAELTHSMENLMDAVRLRLVTADRRLVDVMFRALDQVKGLIEAESAGSELPEISGLIEAIDRFAASSDGTASDEDAAVPLLRPASDGTPVRIVSVTLDADCVLKSVRAYMAIKRLGHIGTILDTQPAARDIEDERFDRTFTVVVQTGEPVESIQSALLAVSEVVAVDVSDAAAASADGADHPHDPLSGSRKGPSLSDTQTVRVSLRHLDAMVDLVGELVIVRSRIDGLAQSIEGAEMREALDSLGRVCADLQREVMDTRMVPVGNILNRFPRLVRDLARDLGREVRLEMAGLDIELDRTVLDEIGDPIVHLIRNAIDHGIEPPEAREATTKPRSGKLVLSATRERDQVRIVVSDDGRGIDAEAVWSQALARGLVAPADRERMSEHDMLMLVCESGLSTVEAPTTVSGRGVGMDVVKGKIEYLGGSVAITSTPGSGTEVALTLPLTLAIAPALLLGYGEQVFALPLSAVEEVLDLESVRVETVDGAPVCVLRDSQIVPLYRLDAVVGHAPEGGAPDPGDHLVLMRSAEALRVLAVPMLIGRKEIVIKPLSQLFREVRGVSGATVLGDGRVALILDPRGLFPTGVRT